MATAWGLTLIVLGLICWAGQAVSWVAPSQAVRLSLMEAEDSVEPVFFADVRAEAAWDTVTLWTMVVAGALLVADNPNWAYFGLVGGGMYLYFAGRGVATRLVMRRRGFRVGTESGVTTAYVFLVVWGVAAVATIVAAVTALAPA